MTFCPIEDRTNWEYFGVELNGCEGRNVTMVTLEYPLGSHNVSHLRGFQSEGQLRLTVHTVATCGGKGGQLA